MTNDRIFELPANLLERKDFGRILDIIIDSCDDEVYALAESILAGNDAEAMPDPNSNEEFDEWHDTYMAPMQNKIWKAILEVLIHDPA